jgi:hypothetical protein
VRVKFLALMLFNLALSATPDIVLAQKPTKVEHSAVQNLPQAQTKHAVGKSVKSNAGNNTKPAKNQADKNEVSSETGKTESAESVKEVVEIPDSAEAAIAAVIDEIAVEVKQKVAKEAQTKAE